ncbi:MAG TPA: hypothetical protein PLV03_08550, partial [Clostridiales bacterium]|nr:hypothetical protein [Clostridiales bacterium]
MKTLSKIGVVLLSMMLVLSFASMALSAVPVDGKKTSSATSSTSSFLDDIFFISKTDDPGTGDYSYSGAQIVVFKKASEKAFVCIDASLQSTFEAYFASSSGAADAFFAKLAAADPSLNGSYEIVYFTAGTTGSYYNSQGKVTSTFTFNSNGTFTITVGGMSHFDLFGFDPPTTSSTPSSSEESSVPSSTPSSSEESSVPSSTPSSSEESSVPS